MEPGHRILDFLTARFLEQGLGIMGLTEDSLASQYTGSPHLDNTAVVGISRPTASLHPNDSSESKWESDLLLVVSAVPLAALETPSSCFFRSVNHPY